MKNKFFEYYAPTDEQIKNIWTNGIIVLDTNMLINLYRYTEKTRNDLFGVLEHYKDRIWIPYQVALEYHRNRISVINKLEVAYNQIVSRIEAENNKFINSLKLDDFKRHPCIDIDSIKKTLLNGVDNIIGNLRQQGDDYPNYINEDEILEKVTNLFANNVGDDFSEDELTKIYKEGKVRYQFQIPPGYKDYDEKKNSGDRRLYGDLIVWNQIIVEASSSCKDIVFVTDDLKEDWWIKECGKTFGPRSELIKEFNEKTGRKILMYKADRFLKYAKDKMAVAVEKGTIEEIKSIRQEDEWSTASSLIERFSNPSTDLLSKIDKPWESASSLIERFSNPSTDLLSKIDKPWESASSLVERFSNPSTDLLSKIDKPWESASSLIERFSNPSTDLLSKIDKPWESASSLVERFSNPSTDLLSKIDKPNSLVSSIIKGRNSFADGTILFCSPFDETKK